MSYKLTPRKVIFTDKSLYHPRDNGVAQKDKSFLTRKIKGINVIKVY